MRCSRVIAYALQGQAALIRTPLRIARGQRFRAEVVQRATGIVVYPITFFVFVHRIVPFGPIVDGVIQSG